MISSEAIFAGRPGGPDVLELREIQVPSPGPSQYLVEMETAGVAFADVMVREGRYPGVSLPTIPGYDIIGKVVAAGDQADAIKVGDRLASLTVTGSYARHRLIEAKHAIHAPVKADPAHLVALILNYATAYQMLKHCTSVEEGDSVLVHGAAGGVGTALLQLCADQGVVAYGTASPGKLHIVEAHGGKPISYREQSFEAEIDKQTGGRGVEAVFDHIGGAHVRRSARVLAPWGVVISYGAMGAFKSGRFSGPKGLALLAREPGFKPLKLLSKNRGVIGFDIAGRRLAKPHRLNADLKFLMEMLVNGRIQPAIAEQMELADAADAHSLLGTSGVAGKIILTNEVAQRRQRGL